MQKAMTILVKEPVAALLLQTLGKAVKSICFKLQLIHLPGLNILIKCKASLRHVQQPSSLVVLVWFRYFACMLINSYIKLLLHLGVSPSLPLSPFSFLLFFPKYKSNCLCCSMLATLDSLSFFTVAHLLWKNGHGA